MPHTPLLARAPRLWGAGAAVVLAAALSGCQAEPAPAPEPTGATSAPSPEVESTSAPVDPADEIALPATCDQIFSPAMLASLTEQNPPLNDPGVTMDSSQIVEALELLASGIPTMRCSWGMPGEYGLATNVSLLEPVQADELATALEAIGFECAAQDDGTRCALERETIDLDDNLVHLGETHFLRGNGWVSTAWINFAPDGYTDDIVATLWG